MNSIGIVFVFLFICIFVFFGLVVFIGAPYVPSQKKYVLRAFEHFGVSDVDTLVDIGSGDGVILRTASFYGAKAVGYEINPLLVGISRLLSSRDPRVSVMLENAWTAQLPKETTFIYAFSVSRDEPKLTHFVQSEANRLHKSLKLLCYGSPFKQVVAVENFEAYHLYIFRPLQLKNA